MTDAALLDAARILDGSPVPTFVIDSSHVIVYWNDAHQITSFKVMVRPFKGLQTVSAQMAETLGARRSAGDGQ